MRSTLPAAADPAPEDSGRSAACYEPYLDGLFTYCLSVLCEHDAATAALGEVIAIAERRHAHWPPEQHRCWLYALARWVCRRRLADRGQPGAPPPAPVVAERRRRELALLAWPEAAGTTPRQREALELAIRHQLSPGEVAPVLGLEPDEARALLASAACEVERTRVALVVVERGNCPVPVRLAGDPHRLLGPSLRRELVRHIDDCAECRPTAERATAGGPWPGNASASGALPLLEAPRAATNTAMAHASRFRSRGGPHYDRRGFPLDPEDRAARRRLLRNRALTTTLVATVVAAPVLALWASYRGVPVGESRHSEPTAAKQESAEPYERTGGQGPDESRPAAEGRGPDDGRPAVERKAAGDTPTRTPAGAGGLTVRVRPAAGSTLVTLTASGQAPVRWSARSEAGWLRLNRTAGVLEPGETAHLTVSVDRDREPRGHWTGRVRIAPSGSVVTIEGRGAPQRPGPGEPRPSPSSSPPEPVPTTSPTPAPSSPAPSAGDSDAPTRRRR
ncbi:BACON domain-containing protein [Streptomyces sp. TP-A0874]|uniref:BACON domain-containing protein n=1 Tax=Streptomyces sp. TP-A0874 TaxID=549819 RepID=UPI000AC69104|nr:hypothetical protein [Streptomyces sp. TP-A0874]